MAFKRPRVQFSSSPPEFRRLCKQTPFFVFTLKNRNLKVRSVKTLVPHLVLMATVQLCPSRNAPYKPHVCPLKKPRRKYVLSVSPHVQRLSALPRENCNPGARALSCFPRQTSFTREDADGTKKNLRSHGSQPCSSHTHKDISWPRPPSLPCCPSPKTPASPLSVWPVRARQL